jgi:hypothetical protein
MILFVTGVCSSLLDGRKKGKTVALKAASVLALIAF